MIGILSAAVLATLDPIGQIHKGRDAQRKSDLSQIQKALEAYYQDNGRYPASSSDYKIIRQGETTEADWGDPWVPYMTKLPKDSLSPSRNYVYFSDSTSNNQSYRLYASLERGGKDPQACQGINNECSNTSGATCGSSVICNYGATSPNTNP